MSVLRPALHAVRADVTRADDGAWSGLDRAVVFALMALHVALFPFAVLIVDSGRDLANGLSIALGGVLPAYGPALFGTWHLGPAWYVLLALPLWLFGSVGATALFVGCIATLKVPLAYALGRRLQDRALGLLCAAFAALPGWHTVGAMVLSHTMLVESAMFATLLAAVCAVQLRRPWLAVLAALLLALALHAHPTALIAAPVVAWALWRGAAGRRVMWIVLAGVAFVLPFVPMLLAEMQSGWPQLAGSGRYVGESAFGLRLLRVPAVVWGLSAHAGVFAGEFFPVDAGVGALALRAGLGLGWVGALGGAVLGWMVGDRRAAMALGYWLLAVVFVCLLRDQTPAWMVYALAPLQVLFFGLGWLALRLRLTRLSVRTAWPVLALVCSVSLLLARLETARDGLQRLPGLAVGDVAAEVEQEAPSRLWLSAWRQDAVARLACGGLALHGDLAVAFDLGQGVAARLQCGDALPMLGGAEAAGQIAGLPRATADILGVRGEIALGFVVKTPLQVLFPARGVPAAPNVAYRADAMAALEEQVVRISAVCTSGDLLVVTNRLPALNPLRVDARRGGQRVEPTLVQVASTYFDCDGDAIALAMKTRDATALDVFVLAR